MIITLCCGGLLLLLLLRLLVVLILFLQHSVFAHIPSLLRSLQTREAKPKLAIFGQQEAHKHHHRRPTDTNTSAAKYIPHSNRQDVQQTRSTFANYLPTYLPTHPTNRHTTVGDQFRQIYK